MTETTYEIEEFCKHERHLYNQNIRMCVINGDISNCENCTMREPEKHKIRLTTT